MFLLAILVTFNANAVLKIKYDLTNAAASFAPKGKWATPVETPTGLTVQTQELADFGQINVAPGNGRATCKVIDNLGATTVSSTGSNFAACVVELEAIANGSDGDNGSTSNFARFNVSPASHPSGSKITLQVVGSAPVASKARFTILKPSTPAIKWLLDSSGRGVYTVTIPFEVVDE